MASSEREDMREKKNNLKLTSKVHTGFGIVSSALGILSIIFFTIAVVTSAFEDRNILTVQYKIGIMETIAIIMSIIGISYGLVGETKKDHYRIFAHIGIGLNVIAMVFHIVVIVFAF